MDLLETSSSSAKDIILLDLNIFCGVSATNVVIWVVTNNGNQDLINIIG